MNPRNAWPAVVLATVAALIVGGMAIAKVDKDTILLVTGVLLVPVLTGLLAAQGAANASAVQSVQQQTNGNTSRMIDALERLGHRLGDAPATPLPAEPASPTAAADPPPAAAA